MASLDIGSEHERRIPQQRGFYRFLTWPFILFEVAVATSEAHAQKFVHAGDADYRAAEETKVVATAPSDEDPDPPENAGKSSTEEGGPAGPMPLPNPTLQSQAPAEAPSVGDNSGIATSVGQQASPSAESGNPSGGGSGTSPSILMPNVSADGQSDGVAAQAFGFGGASDLSQAHFFQTLDHLTDLHIPPAPAFISPTADAIEGIVAAATTPLTTIAIVPTVVEGALSAIEEKIDAAQMGLATLPFSAGETIETAAVTVTQAANVTIDGLESVTELVSSGSAIEAVSATVTQAANVTFDGLDSATELVSSGSAIETVSATVTQAPNITFDGLDSATELVSSGSAIETVSATVTQAANTFDGLDSATELVSSGGSLVFEDSRPPVVDALLDKGGYTDYGLEVGRAVDASIDAHASASDLEADTSNDAAPSLLPDTTLKSFSDDISHQEYHAAGDGLL